ncbi:DNA polymerase epsilon subunit C-like [Quillaja saponaria]|uniref:DNA polymerase epsilon subunit C-like n=1 Tax=Quillaja saponaria TaxID=32244 RepID=A0AAD7VML3_QUISA|nr:DNA polymerase epsilon subunit C-like [Quillaja saponaria]
MASSKNSKAEKKRKDAESTKKWSKTSGGGKEEEKKKIKKKVNKNKTSNGHVSDNRVLTVPSSSADSQEQLEEEDHEEVKSRSKSKQISNAKPKKGKRKQEEEEHENEEDVKMQRFPMNRIKTIIRAEHYDSRISHEAIFSINIATEKFLEQFTQDAYACCAQDRKKSLAYKHLYFVPEKLKAEDALKERSSAGTGEG